MHHFLYPIQDAFISNKTSEKNKNFGLDEMLSIGVSHSVAKVLSSTKTYNYGNDYVSGLYFEDYTGKFTGSFAGTVVNTSGSIVGNYTKFTSSYFIGNVSGSINGVITGSSFINTNFSGSIYEFSGSINSSIIDGRITGSLISTCFDVYTGFFTSSTGYGTGNITGVEIKQQLNTITSTKSYINRSLIKFNLDFISQSISNGDITSPKFNLKIKSTEARELPITFKVYAFPVSQNWDMGDGYWSDEGSETGVSWDYKNRNYGEAWFTYVNTIITSSADYLENYSLVSESFKRGGGTWFNIPCTQSFSHEVSDINMDVTPIVNSWLSSAIPNYGFILMYSGEVLLTSSNANMFFFSNESNTIYRPKLDVQWDDSSWTTGSFGTGSVLITSYVPRLSGSVSSGSTITNLTATGSFYGNAYLVLDNSGNIISGSILDVKGSSLTINGLNIDGNILGISSYSGSNVLFLTASLTSGKFSGCEIKGQFSSSMINGMLSGSFNGSLLSGSMITGNVVDLSNYIINAHQYSIAPGKMIGNVVSGSFHNGIFQGTVVDGLLKGAYVNIPFTGSYSYITSSFSITSSVEITGSSLSKLDVSKPFVVILQNVKKSYSFGDFPKIVVFGREQFPLKSFVKTPQQISYITPKYLPSSSFYSIKDTETEEIIIDFDNYTKISCDDFGNFFYLDTTGLCQERYYKILIRVIDNDKIYTFDSNDLFKIRR